MTRSPDRAFVVRVAFADRAAGTRVEAVEQHPGDPNEGRYYLTGPDLLPLRDWPRPLAEYLSPITDDARELLEQISAATVALDVLIVG
jgi:hypothetical protein